MKYRFISVVVLFLIVCNIMVQAEVLPRKHDRQEADSVQISVDYLKYFLEQNSNWFPQSEELEKSLKGLVHFAEDEKIDTILYKLNQYRSTNEGEFFYRPANKVSDSLEVEGYVPQKAINEKLLQIERAVKNSIVKEKIEVPGKLLEGVDKKVRLLEKNEASVLLRDSIIVLPDSLRSFNVIPDSVVSSPADFRRLQRMDSMKNAILEEARIRHNSNILQQYIDSVTNSYRNQYILNYTRQVQANYVDSIRTMNQQILTNYNNEVMRSVNDSVAQMIDILSKYAWKEPVAIWVKNSAGDSTRVWLRNDTSRFTRMFLKNEQNDSLGVRIINTAKDGMQIHIDDAVTFNRFSTQQKKEFKFDQFVPDKNLRAVDKKYKVITPWIMGGDGTFGFTQTAVNQYWKKGTGSLATMLILKGFANYSYGKVKWENNIEIRNGWMKPSEEKIQKNDDKFQFTTRLGLSAFKKWYYSTELDFQTQFFNGYKYPNRTDKLSAFLAPAKTFVKIGLDYKPNKDFSLLLSPLTAKIVHVRDTVNIKASNYGIPEGKKTFVEPGLNADINFKKDLTPDISYQMKYKMFMNYNAPFSEFDVDWENNLVMQVNEFINLRVMLHFIFDDNVKFKTGTDADGKDILEPKWQVKEFVTVGFSYKLSKRIFRREALN